MKIQLDKLAGFEGGQEGRRLAHHWLEQINSVKDNSEFKRWMKRGETIVKRYRDERNRTDEEGQRRYNALWSNVEILKPALYGRVPLPVAERRFKDKDPAGRNAAQMLERALRNEIEINGYNDAMDQAVSDYLLAGRGTVWVRYEPEIEESVSLPPDPEVDMRDAEGQIGTRDTSPNTDIDEDPQMSDDGRPRRPRLKANDGEPQPEDSEVAEPDDEKSEEEEKLRSTGDRILRESTPVDFVPWVDFFTFPVRARNWAEVTAVCKRVYMSRDQMRRRFGDDVGKHIPLQKDDRGDRTQNTTLQASEQDKGQVYEIWSKDDETVYWVAMGYDYLCDRKDDPLELENFYPCPKPLYANATTNTLIPVPDFIQYQDQAIQIDELTQRISMLAKACKWAGVYNAAAQGIQRLFSESLENELIPVDDWSAFAEKGGVEGNLSILPVKDMINIINELTVVKQKQIEEMDRLTGINDIMRGTSDARETLGGVRLKSNNTGTRLQRRQNEVARFARDTLRIMADIMSQHFSPQSLIEVSGALYEEGLGPDDMPTLTVPVPQPPKPPASGAGAVPPAPGGAVPPPSAPAGGAPNQPPGPMGAPPPPSPGQNVVPFRGPVPPQAPPGAPPGQPGAPPGPPQPGMAPHPPMAPPPVPGPPPIPPEVKAKIDALQRIAGAIKLLRDESMRGFRVDIEVDSTIYSDQSSDKAERTEFITSVTGFLEQSMMLGQNMPESIPLLAKLLQFSARGQRIGRDLELAIEEFGDQAVIIAKQKMAQAQSQPNPQQQLAQLEIAKAHTQLQVQQSKAQSDQFRSQAEIQSTQMKSQAEQQQSQAEVTSQQAQSQNDALKAQTEQAQAQSDAQMQQMQMQIEHLKLQIEYAKLKSMGEQTAQSQQATQQTAQQGQTDLAVEKERTKQSAIEGHHGTQQARYNSQAPAPVQAKPKPQ